MLCTVVPFDYSFLNDVITNANVSLEFYAR